MDDKPVFSGEDIEVAIRICAGTRQPGGRRTINPGSGPITMIPGIAPRGFFHDEAQRLAAGHIHMDAHCGIIQAEGGAAVNLIPV